MTALDAPRRTPNDDLPSLATALRSPIPRSWRQALWLTGWLLLAVMLVHVLALAVTGGPVTGPVSLRKPATFAETGWLTCWSVALIVPWLRLGRRQRAVVASSVIAFGVGETTVMAIEAWRGVPSHYNFTTPLDTVLMRGVAPGLAAYFLVGLGVLLVAAFRSPGTPPYLLLGIRAGGVLLLVACLIGFVMISNMSGVFTGALGQGFGEDAAGYLGPSPAEVGREYVLLRLHTAGGDLVLLHAIGIHGLQLVTLPALALTATRLPERRRFGLVAAMTTAAVGGLVLVAAQSLRAQPLDSLGPVHLGLIGVCAVALLASYAAVARAWLRARRPRQPAG